MKYFSNYKFKTSLLFIFIVLLSLNANSSKKENGINNIQTEITKTTTANIELKFADDILDFANKFKGYRYGYNMPGHGRLDCSGFTSYVFKKFGYTLNRSSKGQYTMGDKITSNNSLLPGDLVFFGGSRATKTVGHVGIVVSVEGNNFKFIHASRTGIRISSNNEEYYSRRYLGARRVLDEREIMTPEKIESIPYLDIHFPNIPSKYDINLNLSFENNKLNSKKN